MDFLKTIIKVLVIAFVYLGLGPMLGYYLNGKDRARRIVLGFMAWWLVRPPSDFTLMLDSVDFYRGHTKGFEFNFIEAIAIGLALAAILEKRRDFKWLPPALWLWFLWVFVSLFSIITADNLVYALMPAFKFAKMGIVFVGVFSAIHDERDVNAVMKGFATALIMQLILCLWNRYVLGQFRIMGWFEHQNPMAMWSYMLAFPILGLAISKETKPRDVLLYFCAFASAGLVVVLSVSRAALAAFAIGSVVIMMGSFFQGVTARRVGLTVVGAIGGVAVMAMAADTFMARMGTDDTPKNDLRWALNQQSAAMLRDHPLTGVGWNNFGIMNSRPVGMKYSAIVERWEANRGSRIYAKNFRRNPLSESLYWLLLAECGLLGFSTFLAFALVTSWQGLRATIYFWRTPLGLFFFGVMTALIITYFHGQVERVLTQTKNLTTWIIFCAILSRAEWWRRRDKQEAKELKNLA